MSHCRYRVSDICVSCEHVTGVPMFEIRQPGTRSRRVYDARRLLTWCLRRWTLMSYPEIARTMGAVHHSGPHRRIKGWEPDERVIAAVQLQMKPIS